MTSARSTFEKSLSEREIQSTRMGVGRSEAR